MIRRFLMKSYRQGLLCVSGLLLLPACIEVPVPDEFTTGIWMLTNGHQVRGEVTDACRPMLMELGVSANSVTLGRRAFPCDTDSVTFESISLQRDGASLLLDGEEAGTMLGHSLEITLPKGAGKISWDLKLADASYQETTLLGTFSADPRLLPDAKPVAIPASFPATEDTPFEG